MKNPAFKHNAYTMVELMIAVAIIAVIAGIAIPAWERARQTAQRTGLINEIRNNADAFQNYATDHTGNLAQALPPTGQQQQIPDGMAPYMPKNSTWTGSPDGGGYWFWLNNVTHYPTLSGYNGYICVTSCGLPEDQLIEIDSLLDDGNLNTGSFGASGGFVYYGVQ